VEKAPEPDCNGILIRWTRKKVIESSADAFRQQLFCLNFIS